MLTVHHFCLLLEYEKTLVIKCDFTLMSACILPDIMPGQITLIQQNPAAIFLGISCILHASCKVCHTWRKVDNFRRQKILRFTKLCQAKIITYDYEYIWHVSRVSDKKKSKWLSPEPGRIVGRYHRQDFLCPKADLGCTGVTDRPDGQAHQLSAMKFFFIFDILAITPNLSTKPYTVRFFLNLYF